jgi:hypothetical protein
VNALPILFVLVVAAWTAWRIDLRCDDCLSGSHEPGTADCPWETS